MFDACSHSQMVKPRPQKSGSSRLSSNRLTNVFDNQILRAHVQTSLETRVCQTEFDKPFDRVNPPLRISCRFQSECSVAATSFPQVNSRQSQPRSPPGVHCSDRANLGSIPLTPSQSPACTPFSSSFSARLSHRQVAHLSARYHLNKPFVISLSQGRLRFQIVSVFVSTSSRVLFNISYISSRVCFHQDLHAIPTPEHVVTTNSL